MRPTDRARLTSALRDHVARIATDLRVKLRTEGPLRVRAKQLHSDEQVGEDFDVWTDLLSRRAAVLWVLKSVYVRVLEDKALLSPGRILDLEAQQLFERLAPNLGESAFLRWVYRDLASVRGGLPELFAPQPAEIATPSDEHSRALINFWRHRDADSGANWSFADERFDGELMGDLYQELDPVVKIRFALCQTPDFIRAFILDRTLTPAIELFGADTVRLLDPACGSGHFLIDGLKRLVAETMKQHPKWEERKQELVRHCLNRVVGIDLNDYACTLARARLVMTAAELAGVSSLAEASEFHPHVYWADGLEQVEKGEDTRGHQLSLLDQKQNEVPLASLTRPEVRAALRKVLDPKFQAVVANPPYITEKDELRKEYHREKVGNKRRYVSASGKYSLGGPFIERSFQLAVDEGFIGIITSNNFMKREFGKHFIEDVLAGKDLNLVIDTSQAYIPFHGTPTVLLFSRNRHPSSNLLRVVIGKRGEEGAPSEPAKGRVWTSICEGWPQVGFENEYLSVADLPRETLAKHPWSLGGGGASELKILLESSAHQKLDDIAAEVGVVAVTLQDDVFIPGGVVLRRYRVQEKEIRPMVLGDEIRDWSPVSGTGTLFPYSTDTLRPEISVDGKHYIWPWRTHLRANLLFGQTKEQRGLKWWEFGMLTVPKLRTPLTIAFAEVATHNHFVLDRGGKVFKQTAPVIKLPEGSIEDDYLGLLGILNSSTACFWMKQVCHPKGSATRDTMVPENNRYAFASTSLLRFPVPEDWKSPKVIRLTRLLDERARERKNLTPAYLLADQEYSSAAALQEVLANARTADERIFQQMVFLQEELDWEIYRAYGIFSGPVEKDIWEIVPEQRPFAWASADVIDDLPLPIRRLYQQRREAIENNHSLSLIETPVFKRPWRGTSGEGGRYGESYDDKAKQAIFNWLCDNAEAVMKLRGRPSTLANIVAAVQADNQFLAAATVYKGRPDIDLTGLVTEIFLSESIANNSFHIFTESGLTKRAAWEQTWALQRREDAGEKVDNIPVPPEYSQGSRGKVTDFLRSEYWQLRGSLDVPKERFIAFTEVPGRDAENTLYGWAGWTPLQRLKALLTIDEELEDAGVPLTARIGVLDSAWRLLPDVAREDAAAAGNLKAELQALVGADGPSREQLDSWRARFPPPGTKAARAAEKTAKKKKS